MEAFGSLEVVSALEHPELVAEPVAVALEAMGWGGEVGVAEINPTLSDTAAFCEQYGIGMDESANCIILKPKSGEAPYVAMMVLGSTRADVNGKARQEIGAKVSFAPMDEAVKESGMEYGAITPIGLPPTWPILIDKAVSDAPRIVIGSGIRSSKLILPGTLLAVLPNARVVEGLAS